MKPVSRILAGFLAALTLLVAGMTRAGGGHNSTSPALGTVQLASILCNISLGSSPQGYVRNNSLNGPMGAAQLRRAGLCTSLAAHNTPYHKHKGKLQASGRHYGREASRTHGHSTVAINSDQRNTDSRDSFKQEAWFVPAGGKQKRVTKHQARKQGWTGPEAMQAAQRSRIEANPSAPPTDSLPVARLHSSDAPQACGESSSRLLLAATGSIVTYCPECDAAQTRTLQTSGPGAVPRQMLRSHGVVRVPRFEPGSAGALAENLDEPKFLIRKFRMASGVMQPDSRFSDDGIDFFALPLPAGDRVAAYTLDQDQLVVLSRPDTDPGLSRVTLINIPAGYSADRLDRGPSSGLWVKGELLRYHDNTLYTVSLEELKLFIYPDLESASSQSLSSVRVVDLSSVGLSEGELISALADSEGCHVAIRRRDPETGVRRIHLYEIDDADPRPKEAVLTGAGVQGEAYQLDFVKGSLSLSAVPSFSSGSSPQAFQNTADE